MKPAELSTESIPFVSSAQMIQAKSLVKVEKRRLLETLESVLDCNPEVFLRVLANTMEYVPISMKEVHTLSPDFEIIPFALAQKKNVLLFAIKMAR